MAAQKDKPADEMRGHDEDGICFTDHYRKKVTIDMAKAVSVILGVVFLAIVTDR